MARLTSALEYGMVAVNCVKMAGAPIPFGGITQAALGRENSRHGLEECTELKYVCSPPPKAPDREEIAMNANVTLKPDIEDLEALDRTYVFHPSTHLKNHADGAAPCRIVRGGEGVHVVDRDGRESLDAFAGLYCVNVGYGRREIADAVHRQMQELAYYHAYVGHGSEPAIELSRRIVELAPAGMRRVYYGLSGSDANETQIKLVWYYNNVLGRPEKKITRASAAITAPA